MADYLILPAIPNESTFGGPYEDAAEGVADPTTDLEAAKYNALLANVRAASYTTPRAIVKVRTNALDSYRAVWGDDVANEPTVVAVGTGHYTVTFASSYNDLQFTPESQTFTVFSAIANVVTSSSTYNHYPSNVSVSANVVTIYTFDNGGTPANRDFDLFVW